jgi:Rrf2 family cysteine metabolism transcriptional repressor
MRASLFSAKAEYACVAVLELAIRYGDPQPVRLKTITDAHGIPNRFLVQILLQLKGAGFVMSTRGAAGGYLLARSPDQITLGEIIGVIDRSQDRASTPAADPLLPTMPVQTIRGVWKAVQSAQQAILHQTTLAELVRRSQLDHDWTYQI